MAKLYFCCEYQNFEEPCLFVVHSKKDVLDWVNSRRKEYGNEPETEYSSWFEINEDCPQISLEILEVEV